MVYNTSSGINHTTASIPVLRANVGPLPVLGGGVMHLEENLQQIGRGHLGRVVLYLNRLGMSRVTCANLTRRAHERADSVCLPDDCLLLPSIDCLTSIALRCHDLVS